MVLFIAMDYEFNLKMISFKLHVVFQVGRWYRKHCRKNTEPASIVYKKNSALINTFKVESVSISTYMLLYWYTLNEKKFKTILALESPLQVVCYYSPSWASASTCIRQLAHLSHGTFRDKIKKISLGVKLGTN